MPTDKQLADALNGDLHGSDDNIDIETLEYDTHNLGVS